MKYVKTMLIVPVRGKKPLPPYMEKLAKAKPTPLIAIELDAAVEVLRVDAAGHVLKKALTVQRWKMMNEFDGEFDLDPMSKVIIAETVDGKTQFRMNSVRISKEYDSDILNHVITTFTGGYTRDGNFGTNQRRKVGETWPVKIDQALLNGVLGKMAQDAGLVLQKDNLEGTVKLAKVERTSGGECLRVDVDMQGSDCFDEDISDERISIEKTAMAVSFSYLYPVDQKNRCELCVESRRWSVLARTRNVDYIMKQTVEERIECRITAVP